MVSKGRKILEQGEGIQKADVTSKKRAHKSRTTLWQGVEGGKERKEERGWKKNRKSVGALTEGISNPRQR